MKKNYFIAIGMVAAMSVAFISCSNDDMNAINASTEAQQGTTAQGLLQGDYTTMTVDPVTGVSLGMTVKDNMIILKTFNNDGVKENVVVKGTFSETSPVLSAETSINGIKSFTFRKVGTSYYEMAAKMTDGSSKEFGFNRVEMATTRAGVSDIVESNVRLAFKNGIKVFMDMNPYVKPFSAQILALIPFLNDAKTSDMKVSACYKELSASMKAIDDKLNTMGQKMDVYNYAGQLQTHRDKNFALDNVNKMYLCKIASILDSLETADVCQKDSIQKEYEKAVKDWGNYSVNGNTAWNASLCYIQETAEGTSDKKMWNEVYDKFTELMYAWEHETYNDRELFRLRDYMVCMESSMLTHMYKEVMEKNGYGVFIDDSKFEKVLTDFNSNQVVEDSTHSICLIPGANHISIDRSSFCTIPQTQKVDMKNYPEVGTFGATERVIQTFGAPTPIAESVSRFYIPSAAYHAFGDAAKAEADKVAATMITISEAKAICKYYGNKMSLRDILVNKAFVTSATKDKDDKPNVLLVNNARVEANKTKKFLHAVYEIRTEACYIDNTTDAFGYYTFGTAEKYLGEWSSTSTWKHYNTNATLKQLTVTSRTADWTPGKFTE